MKEMTIEEKAKAYDGVRDKITLRFGANVAKEIFSQFEESEDERIRKCICLCLEECVHNDIIRDYEKDKCLAWLEKQGEQKLANKIEPKFYEGDWVIGRATNNEPSQIAEITEDGYKSTYGGWYGFSFEEDMHLWTIEDAKDGDVLVCNEEILLFKSYSVQDRISLYCWYNGRTNNFHSKEVDDTLLTTRNKICPATKEQHDLLFQKMREAGYEWDSEKKELKKIEQKPAKGTKGNEREIPFSEQEPVVIIPKFRVGDEIITKNEKSLTITRIDEKGYWSNDLFICDFDSECIWDLVLAEWSEEDETKRNALISLIEEIKNQPLKKLEDWDGYISWLESLKDRVQPKNQWKPSDEQLDALRESLAHIPDEYDIPILTELYEQLKQL